MRSGAPPFDRLEETVTMIARHADCAGKSEIIANCLEDIEDRWQRGELTLTQRFRLYAILVTGTSTRRLLMTVPGRDQTPHEEIPRPAPGLV
jgi:hypothetical protein